MATDVADERLVERAQRELPHASTSFDRLVERHGPAVYRRARRILRSHEDAEDAVQEVFVSVLRALPGYRPERPFDHWLGVVVLNVCRMQLRRRSQELRRRDALAAEAPRWSDCETGDPMLRALLTKLLAALPEDTREAIRLRLHEGRPHAEVADRLGSSLSATKMRIARGCDQLRSLYTQREIGAHGQTRRSDRTSPLRGVVASAHAAA